MLTVSTAIPCGQHPDDRSSWRPVVRGHTILSSLLWLAVASIGGCGPKVTRLDMGTPVDLSGYWNDTDSRLTTEEMVHDALTRPWLKDFTDSAGRSPVVLFNGIDNLTAEHIAQETFLNSIERELLNTGRIVFVADTIARGRLRAERADQATHALVRTRRGSNTELGADYLLDGMISYIEDAASTKQLRVYQVDMRLVSLGDNRVVWAGQKVIRKLVSRQHVRP